ncbi:MAG: proton-conducting transporter membrane subunit, partial [Propionibacteriaceae bacterium]|nr:proton-conducting transporter membrane subunit [Propionibacteriaceae bacterium]
LSAVVILAVAWHAAAEAKQHPALWPLLGLLQAGLTAVFVTGDLFNAYVGLELVGVAAVGLVALGGKPAWEPALRYLLIAVLGSLLFLVALGVVYGATGTLDLRLAGQRWPDVGVDALWVLALAGLGLALKAALFPLHGWLPPAHAAAPTAASPLLSGLVVKAPLVVLLRLWFEVTDGHLAVAAAAAVMGTGAIVWGGVMALRQRRLKRVVAYSTVAQVGYLFLVLPLTLPGTDATVQRYALGGLVTLAVSHGLAKAALFLVASTLKSRHGTDDLDTLPGLAEAWPPMLLAMGLAAISLIGVPVSAGFAGKWQLLSAAVLPGHWWLVAVLLGGSVLSAAYLLRPVAGSLKDPETDDVAAAWPTLGWRHALAPLGLALLAVLLGFSASGLVELALVGWEAR